MSDVIGQLEHKLIVSSQAMNPHSPLRAPETLALLAQAAALGGAGGFRVDGPEVVRLLRAATALPIIGIVKDVGARFDNYITTSLESVRQLVQAGADCVAIQATNGRRPGPGFEELARAAHDLQTPVMGDIATLEEASAAAAQGADILATTMVGHTPQTHGAIRPPLELVRRLLELGLPVVVEGGVWTPEHVRESFLAGAHAVVCGSAITAPDLITSRLVAAIP
jgi:N-acylglucosamine-6-phosphate 2-epimerase